MAKALPIYAVNRYGSLAENAPLMLHTRLEELYRWAHFIADPAKIEELHAMRIAAKRLRYTMEIFSAAFAGKSLAKEFDWTYDKVKAIQEKIGEIHDADVRGQLLRDFLSQHGDSRPEIRIGLQSLIATQRSSRVRFHRGFVASWSKLQKQGFRRRYMQMLTMESIDPMVEESLPANEKINTEQG